MDIKNMIEKLFAEGKKHGMEEMEVYYGGGNSLTLKVFEKELDGYSLSEAEGLSFRGVYKGKMGYSYTEKVDETSIELLVKGAIENAKVIDSDDEELIYEGSKEYKEVNNYNEVLKSVKEEDKIKFVKELEQECFKLDERITSVETCVYGDGYGETVMSNTKGLFLQEKSNIAYTYVVVIAKESEHIKTGFAYKTGNDFSKFNAKEIANLKQ